MTTQLIKHAWDVRDEIPQNGNCYVILTENDRATAKLIGKGSISAGIKIALSQYMVRFETEETVTKPLLQIFPIVRSAYSLSYPYAEIASQLGSGDMSTGIRIALRLFSSEHPSNPFRTLSNEAWSRWVKTTRYEYSSSALPEVLRKHWKRTEEYHSTTP